MGDPRQMHGNHTWDLVLYYHRCPSCGFIMENRDKFEPRFHLLQKDLVCPRCQQAFTITKKQKPTFGPLLGHNPEIAE